VETLPEGGITPQNSGYRQQHAASALRKQKTVNGKRQQGNTPLQTSGPQPIAALTQQTPARCANGKWRMENGK
jgi:hypothetical protein